MPEDPVLQQIDEEGVLLITLNRPDKKNAFNDPQWDGLRDALNAARDNPAIAVVLLTGAGRDFSSGQDLTAFTERSESREDGNPNGFAGCVDAVFAFDKPILAAVKGIAVGGGCTLAVACDIVYVGESLRMRLPFANLGLVPEFASSYTVQSAIGRQRAAELFFTAEWIDAARALEVGLAARCFADADLLPAALEKAREIAQWPISALRGIKHTLRVANDAGIAAARKAEDRGMAKYAGSPENIEAITAFIQKRKPDFRKFRS
jgi:enoyl-CoA hydratase/carnithine racemase